MYLYCVSGYPLAVKLGAIKKDGKADMYSYDEDNMVEDPNLIAHVGTRCRVEMTTQQSN